MQLVAIWFYKPKRFLTDVEFVVKKRIGGFAKTLLLLLLLPVIVLAWEVWKTTFYFTYKGLPIPNWALGIKSIVQIELIKLKF